MTTLPKSAVLELTYKCNHKCKFCSCPWYAPNGSYYQGQELDLVQWKYVIDKLYDCGVESFSISGGECLLKDCLAEILLYIKDESWKRGKPNGIVLISNGLIMSKDYLELFKYCNVHIDDRFRDPGYCYAGRIAGQEPPHPERKQPLGPSYVIGVEAFCQKVRFRPVHHGHDSSYHMLNPDFTATVAPDRNLSDRILPQDRSKGRLSRT